MSRRVVAMAVVALLAGVLVGCDGAPPERVYTYRIATRGPVTADLGQFAQHVAATLSDPRGWTLGGAIQFRQTSGSANFTVYLATAGSLPSFGPPCSAQWSCRSGSSVIINQDRWTGATPTWPYSLDSYQHYVVNHEVGHWLGLGHRSCTGGFGDRAPVMAQQSKGGAAKGACRFNVWPNPDERGAVGRLRGATPRSTGLPNPDDPFGNLDGVSVSRDARGKPDEVRLTGWTIDGDTAAPLGVIVLVDDVPVDIVLANKSRPDLVGPFPRYGAAHGFDVTVDVGPGARTACIVAGGEGAGVPLATIGCSVVK